MKGNGSRKEIIVGISVHPLGARNLVLDEAN